MPTKSPLDWRLNQVSCPGLSLSFLWLSSLIDEVRSAAPFRREGKARGDRIRPNFSKSKWPAQAPSTPIFITSIPSLNLLNFSLFFAIVRGGGGGSTRMKSALLPDKEEGDVKSTQLLTTFSRAPLSTQLYFQVFSSYLKLKKKTKKRTPPIPLSTVPHNELSEPLLGLLSS